MSRTKTAPTIEVVANGEPRTIPDGQTVAAFLAGRGLDPDVVVVERNGEIVPRSRFGELRLEADDRLEVVHFVGGG
ncbi:MAG: sulfur carrier protein ThiS [Gemmatimonadota bacterium]